ncbi:hypothetical protein LSAT2_015205 [Lamellibrachia satsuma]|nr:hypothetical protein LSAT2_015205 [Lamellibrachia satsuma]
MECRKWQLCLIAMAALWYCANADCPNGDCDQRHHHHHHDNGTIIGAFMGWSTFSKWGHRRAAGGTLQSRGYSLRDCEAACMKDIPCVAIDYVPWLWECWIYHKVSPVSVLQKDENVNHYRPARCSSSKARSEVVNPNHRVITRRDCIWN